MSTAVLAQPNWQDYATASINSFAAHQGAVTPSSQAMLQLISSYDSVTFDFSDWTPDQLNENTTSFFWGLQNGSLDISCYNISNGNLTNDVHAVSLAADNENKRVDVQSQAKISFASTTGASTKHELNTATSQASASSGLTRVGTPVLCLSRG
ncbi:hypothetical protein O1611_g6269 [Lasiodiplodia mahajangana]|uniref:Uncharacterized protein n=1 Tax=Lasiodiplodia mahajangana TaxID=1108764 RepID=A0ACC2JIQ0_9PEZI|nr:hypothetical protein O1611_g6269 [Lasiodiplodia mahajangana]